MAFIRINLNEIKKIASALKVGDNCLLTGVVYTARDAAHKRMDELLSKGESLPIPIDGAVIYYAGPTPAKEGQVIGSCGPTTSGRMDAFAPRLLDIGLSAMIGKGSRNENVRSSLMKNKSVYFCAIGGAGALAAQCIKSCEVIAFEELGCESVKRLYVEDFPVVVAMDSEGRDIYKLAVEKFAQ